MTNLRNSSGKKRARKSGVRKPRTVTRVPFEPSLSHDRLVQYIVGLCCIRHRPESVEIVLGDMVQDESAEEARDVDVTILVPESDGARSALSAYEAKDERRPIDVKTVEQLSAKLDDMPDVRDKAIVSTSGYTKPAIRKAKAKGVTLYIAERWTAPMQSDLGAASLPGTPAESLRFANDLLIWLPNHKVVFRHAGEMKPETPMTMSDSVLNLQGAQHERFPNLSALVEETLGRSTNQLLAAPEVLSSCPAAPEEWVEQRTVGLVGSPMSCTHRCQIGDLGCAFEVSPGDIRLIEEAEITGQIQWSTSDLAPEYWIVKDVTTRAVFAAAAIAIAPGCPPRIVGLAFATDSSDVTVHVAEFTAKHQQQFREIRLR